MKNVILIFIGLSLMACGRENESAQVVQPVKTCNYTNDWAPVQGLPTCAQSDSGWGNDSVAAPSEIPICDSGYVATYSWYSGCNCCNDKNECPKSCSW